MKYSSISCFIQRILNDSFAMKVNERKIPKPLYDEGFRTLKNRSTVRLAGSFKWKDQSAQKWEQKMPEF